MNILLIDHDDSFIYNIKAWLQTTPCQLTIINYHQIPTDFNFLEFDGIILSPGPKSPNDYPRSLELLKTSTQPIFGICLGFQMMITIHNGNIHPYSPVFHGKTSALILEDKKINIPTFDPLKNFLETNMLVARYNSLGLKKEEIKSFSPLQDLIFAYTPDEMAMIFYDSKNQRLSFQFHPESFLTEHSTIWAEVVNNWFQSCKKKKDGEIHV